MSRDASVLSLHTTLLSAMLGASIGLAIDKGIEHASAWVVIAIIGLVLHTVNFYHGKTVALYDVNELIRTDARPVIRATLIAFNSLLFLVFCVMAAGIHDPRFIGWGEVVLRFIDILGVAGQQRLLDRSPGARSMPPAVRRQLRFWQVMNVIVFGWFLGAMLLLPRVAVEYQYPLVVASFSAFVLLDLVIEYTVYAGNYYRRLSDWNTLAERWDRMQGCYGDRYRQTIIHPFVERWLRDAGVRAVVDLGSGNGCTARWLADRGGLRVVGVDGASALVDLAELYEVGHQRAVRYVREAIDALHACLLLPIVESLRREEKGALAFISLFGAQDCENVSGFFTSLRRIMAPGEHALLVFESEASFHPNAAHAATVRTWKYSWRKSERIQIVSWLPVTNTEPTSVFAGSRADSPEIISLLTRQRTAEEFLEHALPKGFRAVAHGAVRLRGEPSTPDHLAYERAPKFEYLHLTLAPD